MDYINQKSFEILSTLMALPFYGTELQGCFQARIQGRRCGSRGGEMGEFSPPPLPPSFFFSEPPFAFFFFYPLNIAWFYYIITKIHPPFQNPGPVPGLSFN